MIETIIMAGESRYNPSHLAGIVFIQSALEFADSRLASSSFSGFMIHYEEWAIPFGTPGASPSSIGASRLSVSMLGATELTILSASSSSSMSLLAI